MPPGAWLLTEPAEGGRTLGVESAQELSACDRKWVVGAGTPL
jgi:hypothetical protein